MPRFAKRYINLAEEITKALQDYKKDVEEGKFPAEENYFHMAEEEFRKLMRAKKRNKGAPFMNRKSQGQTFR